ncbi:D-lactate dehydrogenase [Aspergillus udagawae]|uniref:D-lactate dehydrogenase n=1 Tax=Aspergillus udagawae TaxID=91492 RepID=A0A8H3RSK4_9EURO|nr:D-lactate dehydrogenase [Aspergillus udagawae]
MEDLRKCQPNAPNTYDPHRLPVQRMPQEPLEIEVPLPHAVIRTVGLPIQSLDQRHGEFGHGFGSTLLKPAQRRRMARMPYAWRDLRTVASSVSFTKAQTASLSLASETVSEDKAKE